MRCPCRKKSETTAYADCCEPFHTGRRAAPSPEALMRSRYAAFVLENDRYLSDTWHISTRPQTIAFDPAQEWLALRIKDAHEAGEQGWVAFEARARVGGRTQVLKERSRFVRADGRWFYVDGDVERS